MVEKAAHADQLVIDAKKLDCFRPHDAQRRYLHCFIS